MSCSSAQTAVVANGSTCSSMMTVGNHSAHISSTAHTSDSSARGSFGSRLPAQEHHWQGGDTCMMSNLPIAL